MFALLAMAGDLGGSIGPAIEEGLRTCLEVVFMGMRIDSVSGLRCVLCYFYSI